MSLGLVHRDVSPQNILIGVDGMSRVLDFGVAKAAGRAQSTREGVLKGKLGYMAPEQIHQEPIGRAADIHAAAVVLWEALVGTLLFRGGSEAEVLANVLAHDVEPPGTRVPDLPSEVDAIVMRGLARSPGSLRDGAGHGAGPRALRIGLARRGGRVARVGGRLVAGEARGGGLRGGGALLRHQRQLARRGRR